MKKVVITNHIFNESSSVAMLIEAKVKLGLIKPKKKYRIWKWILRQKK